MKRNGVNTASNGGTHSPGSQSAAGEGHLNNSSSRDHAQKSSQSWGSNDHPQQQRTSFRNRNGGLHSRGDVSHHHSYGGRRNDLDLANHDWNAHRNFSRDGHMQPLPRVAPRHMRHPPPPPPTPATSPFIALPPVRPFGLVGFPGKPHLFTVLLWLIHGSALISQSVSRYGIAIVLCFSTSRFYERCAYYCSSSTISYCFFPFRSSVAH